MAKTPTPFASPTNRWLLPVRVLVFLWLLFQVWRVAVHLPEFYGKLVRLQPSNGLPGWTQAEIQRALPALGISPQGLAAVLLAASLACLLVFWAIAFLLFWLKGSSWVGLLSAYVLSGVGVGFSFLIPDTAGMPAWAAWMSDVQALFLWPTFFLLLYLFPDGRFVPRSARFLTPLPYLIFFSAYYFLKDDLPTWLEVMLFAYAVGGVISQVYRYRRVSGREQRQQTKWVVFAIALIIALVLVGQIENVLIPAHDRTPSRLLMDIVGNYLLSTVTTALLPIAIGISILRYRLWDIDLVIRRTLVYSILSGMLALAYFGAVAVFQQLSGALGGRLPDLAIILSTLSIAALFAPLRARVQAFIDRRFYRPRYNAEQAVAAMASAVRDEVDIRRIRAALLAAVDETVQPEQSWLWLKHE